MRSSWRFATPLVVWLAIVLIPHPAGLSSNAWNYLGLFAGVIAWQLATCGLLACALVVSVGAGAIDLRAATLALASGTALWAAFMLADEITVKYEFERTHELLFIAQLATLVALHVLPG